MIGRILPHFPHLTHIRLHFPTVKFLRGFAKTMVTSGPESFQHLVIKIQFDFASSLDSCVLDAIAKPNSVEKKQIKTLKAYAHWKEYVEENSIELPQEKREKEDPEKFCGLRVLFKKLKSVNIQHTPRILRLPKGRKHWIDDPHPDFSKTLIGFKKYPFSKAVEAECPPTMTIILPNFDTSNISFKGLKPAEYISGPVVRLEPAAQPVKREVKFEKKSAPKE